MNLNFLLAFKSGFVAVIMTWITSCSLPQAINEDGTLVAPRQISSALLNRGFSEFETYKKKNPISRDPAKNAQLQRVAGRLKEVVDMPQARWEFVVFENETPNAFALPGGKVGVHSGLFQVTQSDVQRLGPSFWINF
jgi:metalloendopeptidase OMA1, mitochondrial